MTKKVFKRQNLAVSVISGISGFIGLSLLTYSQTGTKYDMVEFCFKPHELTHIESAEKFCTNDKKYAIPIGYWNEERYTLSNPRFQRDDIFILSEKAHKLGIIPASNPDAYKYALFSIPLLGAGAVLFSLRINRYKLEFPIYYESVKTDLNLNILEGEKDRSIHSHKSQVEEKYYKDELDKQDKDQRFMDLTPEERQATIEDAQLNYERASGQSTTQYDLMIQQLREQLAKSKAETVKHNLEEEKLMKKLQTVKGQTVDTNSNEKTNQLKKDLINALKQHENGWLWSIINNATPIWLIGRQGSGKTFTAASIALVRKHCLDASIYYLIDRHAGSDNEKAWQYLYVDNKAISEEEIDQAFKNCVTRWKQRILDKVDSFEQIILDEFTHLKDLIGDSAAEFYKMHLSDTRKAKSMLVAISHTDTNSAYPEGTKAMREAGTILIKKFSKNGRKPLSKIEITRGYFDNNGDEIKDFQGTIPIWFSPDKLDGHFNGVPINFDEIVEVEEDDTEE